MLLSTFIWVLAVIKVFVLENSPLSAKVSADNQVGFPMPTTTINKEESSNFRVTSKTFKRAASVHDSAGIDSQGTTGGFIPYASEWLLMRQHQGGNPYVP